MNIGYDGKRATCNFTGLGNYSRLLIEELSRFYPENEYVLYTPEVVDNPRVDKLRTLPNVRIELPDTHAGRAMSALWRQWGVTYQAKRYGTELFHGLAGELPLNIVSSGLPSVVTIHDLIFRRLPDGYKPIDREIYDYKYRRACEKATRIIAISERTKQDIVDDYGINPEKIDVVYQGCDPQFNRRPSDDEIRRVKERYGIKGIYIVCVGTVESRKNQILALRGLRGLPLEFNLVIVGRRSEYADVLDEYIRTYHIADRVTFIENVAFTDLPALYAGAFCSSYTSRYEGFGIPVIESMSVGTPVIVAKGSCLEEAGGPHTPAVDPDNIDEWLYSVKQLYEYPEAYEKVRAAGLEYVRRFTPENFARDTYATYLRCFR